MLSHQEQISAHIYRAKLEDLKDEFRKLRAENVALKAEIERLKTPVWGEWQFLTYGVSWIRFLHCGTCGKHWFIRLYVGKHSDGWAWGISRPNQLLKVDGISGGNALTKELAQAAAMEAAEDWLKEKVNE